MKTFNGTRFEWLERHTDLFTFKKGDFAENMQNIKTGANLYKEWLENYVVVRSAYKKGLLKCRLAMLESMAESAEWYIYNKFNGKYFDEAIKINDLEEFARLILLNGAQNIEEWVEGGSSLIYNNDICTTFCPPSVQRKKNYGLLPPSRYGSWLDLLKKAEKMNYFHVMRWFAYIEGLKKEASQTPVSFVCKKCGHINRHINNNACARCGHIHEN